MSTYRGMSLDGVPAHMLRTQPVLVEVTQHFPGPTEWTGPDGVRRLYLDRPPLVTQEPLYRDGVKLRLADQRGWRAGEADGWRPTKVDPPAPSYEEHVIEDVREELARG